jgi:tetraacyldisaccharide 4'-kinase
MTINSFFQLLLLPLSWLYGVGVFVRNKQFDLGFRKQVAFEIPVIVIGNLSVGGTGKTPMTAYLLNRLLPVKKSGVLSRGYRRKSTGYMEVTEFTAVSETGDEPKLIKQKFPHAMVAISESRALGIATMIHENPELELVILDDAYQHRQIVAGLSLLLTEYAHPFSRDRLLPAGRLREPVAGSKRADGIIVTKCPHVTLTVEERNQLALELATFHPQPVFFSYLKYGEPYHISDSAKKYLMKAGDEVLLFAGLQIQNPWLVF